MPASEPGPGEARGRIVFLNGTSSAGKSSIAGELVRLLDAPWFVMSADAFHAMRSAPAMGPDRLEGVLRRTWSGFHRAVAGMAAAGNDLVVDHVLSELWRLRDCLDLFVPEDVVLVEVRCPLPELERRERLRGDRPAGLAARQFSRVHGHGDYDVVVDSGERSPQECAREIAAFLRLPPADPTAFARMKAGGAGERGA
ncbi:chloramphenicol phosphotransferase CPT family protein [Streptomyces koyangensis]|uniref:Chloramphenicol phosphotransferase n=1 Tax=Streptomyces koyangensis TaxID=188770 RepID=A0A385DJS9_9ACTN|nr:AAA family ATPase [Streptomyces koyangensis]AXQ57927.1 chloramphenicol phosphotransferase [Streptomyces koyangensis]